MINSKQKGKTGELEWAKFCHEHGFKEVRRSQQYCGKNQDASDCIGLPNVYQEVKRVEHLNINNAMTTAVQDAGDKIPIVAHRKNRSPWLVTMQAKDWFKLYKGEKQ
jgi:hypothetical protein